jgi:hypothetical protein
MTLWLAVCRQKTMRPTNAGRAHLAQRDLRAATTAAI